MGDAQYAKINKGDTTRSTYIRRTMEIMAVLKRHKEEISKVLTDVRMLQKEISTISEKMTRQHALAENMIFKDAKKDGASKQAYKHLARIHELCETCVEEVEKMAVCQREVREFK